MSRRAKIVCTLGPASSSAQQVLALVEAGMDVARLNFSHGTWDDHRAVYRHVRRASETTGRAVGVLVDLQGPKIRLGRFAAGATRLVEGSAFTITTRDVPGTAARCSTAYRGLPGDVAAGDRILIDDGRLVLEVEDVAGPDVRTVVRVGGPVSDHKGINLPGVAVGVPALSGKDVADLRFALDLGADVVALSFVRSPEDIDDVHAIMDEVGVRRPVIAKIEKPQAVGSLEAIVKAFDGIMVARGDLGVELPLEQVPMVQKEAITLARRFARPVIVATQMLESMIVEPRPTRAEASDVANAVLDGTDAVMLSGETSIGRYPLEAVRTMSRIVLQVESTSIHRIPVIDPPYASVGTVMAQTAVIAAERLEAKAICAFTETGDTVHRVARHRDRIPLLAFTTTRRVRDELALTWGAECLLVGRVEHTDEMIRQVDHALMSAGRLALGDRVVIVAGSPPGTAGTTNMIRVHRIGGR